MGTWFLVDLAGLMIGFDDFRDVFQHKRFNEAGYWPATQVAKVM